MVKPSKLFFLSMFSSKNIFNLILSFILLTTTLAGVWLLHTGQYQQFTHNSTVVLALIAMSLFLSLVFVVRLSLLAIKNLQQSISDMEMKNRHNQDAILRLLDEMEVLADGDLTASATVTDEITGAIADSVNFTVDELRNLVTKIDSTTIEVASAAQETQATALHLTDASDHQAQQITEVSSAITEMAASIE